MLSSAAVALAIALVSLSREKAPHFCWAIAGLSVTGSYQPERRAAIELVNANMKFAELPPVLSAQKLRRKIAERTFAQDCPMR
jgi:hypothetical protein